MKNIIAIAGLLLCANVANAQQMTAATYAAGPTSAFADPIVRVTTPFRVTLPPSDNQAFPTPEILTSARHGLYRMAEAECTTLSEIYKADCRLNSLTVSTYGSNAGNMTPGNLPTISPQASTMTANAVYELRMRSPQR